MAVDNVVVSESNTISLFYNQTYAISCSSVGSKPDVSLSLFDTASGISLSNGQNNITSGSCDSNTLLCNEILQIVFSYDSIFDQMTSITCKAESKYPSLYPLTASISRSVLVVPLPPTTTTTTPISTSFGVSTTTLNDVTSKAEPTTSIIKTTTSNVFLKLNKRKTSR